MHRLISIVLVATLAGCAPMAPPAAPSPRAATEVAASQARAWDAVIDVFASRNIPIKNMDRASGFISTDPLAVDVRQGKEWADCGKVYSIPVIPDRATYNVLVRGDSSRAAVKVTARWTQGGTAADPQLIECSTKHVWEQQLEAEIKARAEGALGAS